MQFGAIIVAAGEGRRAGGRKQFRPLGGRPLFRWSLDVFAAEKDVREIVLVVPPDEVARLADGLPCRVVAGGRERRDSVLAGLRALPGGLDRVLIHDAARPGLSSGLLERILAASREHPAVIPVLRVPDTVKRVRGKTVVETLDREEIRLAQTPQAFAPELLLRAYAEASGPVTDDAQAVEALGEEVFAVMGEESDFKITGPDDWRRAWALAPPFRTGFGYDVHRFQAGRPLFLGGVEIPSSAGLAGHSDADVLLHALMDALLGAAAEKDIGHWFPPDDPAWEGASSRRLLEQVLNILSRRSLAVWQADLTVVAERPRLADHVPAIRAQVAADLGLPMDRVGFKATTNEGLGAIGRGEGIAAWATVLVWERSIPGGE